MNGERIIAMIDASYGGAEWYADQQLRCNQTPSSQHLMTTYREILHMQDLQVHRLIT